MTTNVSMLGTLPFTPFVDVMPALPARSQGRVAESIERRLDLGLRIIHARVAVHIAQQDRHKLAAKELVIAGYASLAGNELPLDEVASDLYPVRPLDDSAELCVVARVNDLILTTGSLSYCKNFDGITEALRLFTHPDGWDRSLGFPAGVIGEMGRFAMAPMLQRKENRELGATIVRESASLLLNCAREIGLRRVVAVMPPSTMRMTASAGLRFHEINDAVQATGNPEFQRVFQKYPRYWLPENVKLCPKIYWFEFPSPAPMGY